MDLFSFFSSLSLSLMHTHGGLYAYGDDLGPDCGVVLAGVATATEGDVCAGNGVGEVCFCCLLCSL